MCIDLWRSAVRRNSHILEQRQLAVFQLSKDWEIKFLFCDKFNGNSSLKLECAADLRLSAM